MTTDRFQYTAPQIEKKGITRKRLPRVNAHLHTPYSFSSFYTIEQIFQMAMDESIDVLGINDFFTVDGYRDFNDFAKRFRKYPLFNIEFMGLLEELQKEGVRINDPNNPGRIYFSGKGLRYPVKASPKSLDFLDSLARESMKQVEEMCAKINALLQSIDPELYLSFAGIREVYARNLVRERHLAKAIKNEVFKKYDTDEEKAVFFEKLFGGKKPTSSMSDATALEDEIRGKLLKAGGVAYVPETKESFPPLEDIIAFIVDTGGIPCYPVLLDDKKGNIITKFESDWEQMATLLGKYKVPCVELIPARNSVDKLTEFVKFFHARGFVILLGSEHNTPGLFPLEVKIEGDQPLSEYLDQISYEGACVVAAHQYLVASGKSGYIDAMGEADKNNLQNYINLGNEVILDYIK